MKRNFLSTYTGKIIIINLAVFFFSLILLNFFGEGFLRFSAIQANEFFSGKVWTALTSMFMHIGIGHLLANMISLFFIGLFVEQLIGKKRFIIFYIIAGLFAGLFYAVMAYYFGGSDLGAKLFGSPTTFALGASGAIFGLLGLLAVLTPKNKVYLIVGPLIAIVVQVFISSVFPSAELASMLGLLVTLYFIFAIFAIFSLNQNLRRWALPLEMPFWILPIVAIIPLVVIGLFVPLPIGNSAHFGGLIAGIAYALYLRKKYPKKTAMIARRFSK